jgi:hypothetical protein
MGTATEPKGAATAGEYLRWKKDVAQHDYTAASSYLSIRFGETHAEKVAAELRKLPVITRRANDILRATGRIPLPLSDPGVLKDLKKVLAGQKLSPILVAESDIADGYHRLSLAYALDPYATVPLKLGGVSLLRPLRVRRLPADQLAVRVAGVVAARGGRHHVGGAVRHHRLPMNRGRCHCSPFRPPLGRGASDSPATPAPVPPAARLPPPVRHDRGNFVLRGTFACYAHAKVP